MQIDIELEYPIVWNAERTWSYILNFKNSNLQLKPTHFTAISDLIADWGTLRSDYSQAFVPIVHYILLTFDGISCMLNNGNLRRLDSVKDERVGCKFSHVIKFNHLSSLIF